MLRWLLCPGCPQRPRRTRGKAASRPFVVRGAPPAERGVGRLTAAPGESVRCGSSSILVGKNAYSRATEHGKN